MPQLDDGLYLDVLKGGNSAYLKSHLKQRGFHGRVWRLACSYCCLRKCHADARPWLRLTEGRSCEILGVALYLFYNALTSASHMERPICHS